MTEVGSDEAGIAGLLAEPRRGGVAERMNGDGQPARSSDAGFVYFGSERDGARGQPPVRLRLIAPTS